MKVALHTWTPETGLLPEVEPWAEPGEDLLLVWGPEVLLRAFLRFGRGAGDLRQSLILGCSGSGSILGPTVSDEHLVVARLRFLQTRLKVAGLPAGGPGRSRETGLDLAGCLRDDGLRHVLVFSDGLTVNGSELVEGLKEGLVPGVTLSGGLAGDGTHFRETHVVVGDRLASGWVGAVGFYGPSLHVRCASVGGWDPFGPVRRITRSQDNVLHELDGKSALSLYRTYLGPYARDLPASALYFPLSISAGDGRLGLVRTVLRIDEESKAWFSRVPFPRGGRLS